MNPTTLSCALLVVLSAPQFARADVPPITPSGGTGIVLSAPASNIDGGPSTGDHVAYYLSKSLSPLALAGGAFLLYDNRNHPGEASHALEGIALTGLVTVVVKKVVNERRPDGGGGSFPSGHASLAFSMATALSEYHPQYRLPAYGLATAIAVSRVKVKAHYWHDVAAGGALGYFTTKHFMRHHSSLAITPSGIGLEKQF